MDNNLHSNLLSKIAAELGIRQEQVISTIALLEEGATVPFISRYRKEVTGSLDEVAILFIRDRYNKLLELEKRRSAILSSLEERNLLTAEIKQSIEKAMILSELEDIYLPFRPKKRTRATIAIEKGLKPLADQLFQQENIDPISIAKEVLKNNAKVTSIEEALSGARDIIAEKISEDKVSREKLRYLFKAKACLSSRVSRGKKEEAKNFIDYFEYTESIHQIPPHRILAMFRGENESFLKIAIEPPVEDALIELNRLFIKKKNKCSEQVSLAIEDGYERLLQPSLETEFRNELKEKADSVSIQFFADNLRQLLNSPPLGNKPIMAIDPGFRTGCKVVCLDAFGNFKEYSTIFPHPPNARLEEAKLLLSKFVKTYNIEVIAIGNGTAGRETEQFIKTLVFAKDIPVVMVNESGASVYSASEIARSEFPNYDVTVRGAISIGRRLMDPLAELVKIDPRSIGVGQYQHDVDQNQLKNSLEDTVVSCVNNVGVELNTCSKELLSYVSGIGNSLANHIIEYRNKVGKFRSREELKKVPRLGARAFEQAAGFLRIRDGENPLDASAVHPESYPVVYKMAQQLGCKVQELLCNETALSKVKLENFVDSKVGLPTLKDILTELKKPGRDPRKSFEFFSFAEGVEKPEDLKPGMKLPGVVTNITAFGVFVDIGVHQDGLVHISQLSNQYVKNPLDVVKLQDKVTVTVVSVDIERKRISLSMK
jgi:protein Tex